MKIRAIKENEIKTASKIVGLNHSGDHAGVYSDRSKNEMTGMFRNYGIRPRYLVAEDKGKLLGFAGYSQSWISYHIYEIFWVNVLPRHQNKGIGTALINKIIRIIKKNVGIDSASMIILTTNSPRFYRRFGFKPVLKFRKENYLMRLNI
jgi:ribosomal protein S18 acetylase RimI-like enzyme